MESKLKKFDEVKDYFAQKMCIIHKKRPVYSICLHEDCWKLKSDGAFLCYECTNEKDNGYHKDHGDSLKYYNLYHDAELFDDFDDFLKTKDNLKARISKFEKKIDELHLEIQNSTISQFSELKTKFSNNLIDIDNFEAIKNTKMMLCYAELTNLSLNYESKEKVKNYCTQIQKIQNDLNFQLITKPKTENDKMDEYLNFKLENIKKNIQEYVKNQVNELAEYLIKKSKPLKNEFAIKEAESTSILAAEMPIVKNC